MQSILQQCPGCSAVISFAHSKTNLISCRCGTVVSRGDDGQLQAQSFYLLQQPFEFIAPGTTGTWQGSNFEVLGRIRVWFEESVFNYWTIALDDGELAFLAEGYGLYAILREAKNRTTSDADALARLDIGHSRRLGVGEDFLLEKKDQCKRWELEGEAWLPYLQEQFTVCELATEQGQHLHLFQFQSNCNVLFNTAWAAYELLELKAPRNEPWPGHSFNCKQCQAHVLVKTHPYAQSCACTQCGTRYVLEGADFKAITGRNDIDYSPDLPLHGKGKIFGAEYEIVGFSVKRENNLGASQWREYVLHNPVQGYAHLSEYDGHWIFLREEGATPVVAQKSATEFDFDGETFQLFNAYDYEVLHAVGEFAYNAFDNNNTAVKEYISPPEIWTQERSKKEGIIWFFGRHISGREIKKAFGESVRLPYQKGVGAVEPKFFVSPPFLLKVTAVAALLLVLLHLAVSSTKRNQLVFEEQILFADSTTSVNLVTQQPIRLDKWRSNLKFDIWAPVENDWFELNATLVNTSTGTEYSLEKGVEYYYGYSEGEHWKEGSQQQTAYITRIPAGNYQLQLQGVRPAFTRLDRFRVEVYYDVSNTRNLLFSILLLLIWPGIQYLRTHNNEKNRWENSPYTPFNYED